MSNRPKPDKHNIVTIMPIMRELRTTHAKDWNPRYIRLVAEQIAKNRAVRQSSKPIQEELNEVEWKSL